MRTIYLAGGCFWGVQKFFDQFPGVRSTEVGYANGPEEREERRYGKLTEEQKYFRTLPPGYQEVCGKIGFAETVKVTYDETVLSLTDLLGYYFLVIDPLSVNRQGPDTGIQYRTGIYYEDEDLLPEIRKVWDLEAEKAGQPLAVEVEPLRNYYTAEEYHQKYLDKNPSGYCHIPRKLMRLDASK